MHTAITNSNGAKPIGPYNQAIIAANMVFVSAQFAQDPKTGKLVMDNIEAETRQVMENIKAILQAAGTDLAHVVKASIFLKDINDYASVNAVYGSYFIEPYPARETIQVVALPKNVNIEISAIAVKD